MNMRSPVPILALSLLAAVPATAATATPQPVSAYLAMCKTGAKACKYEVVRASIFLMSNRDDVSNCLVAKMPNDNDVMTKQVVDWLSSHPTTGKAETTEAIQGALMSIYCG